MIRLSLISFRLMVVKFILLSNDGELSVSTHFYDTAWLMLFLALAELNWLLSVEDLACKLTDMQLAGELPLRVAHNDTKINNVLFDMHDHSGSCSGQNAGTPDPEPQYRPPSSGRFQGK